MINQTSAEAVYSASYVETYLDYVEHLPDDIQRCISRVRELDLTYNAYLREIEQHREALQKDVENDSAVKKKAFLVRVQQSLIAAQEVGDEKLQILQQVQDLIENNSRTLDTAYKNWIESDKKLSPTGEANSTQVISSGAASVHGILGSSGNGSSGTTGSMSSGAFSGERQSKRVRRTRTDIPLSELAASMDTTTGNANITGDSSRNIQQPNPLQATTGLANAQKKAGTSLSGALGKKKKRKSRQGNLQQQSQQQARERDRDRDDSPMRDDEIPIDPDEPTYCLCNQISYGEMIMCDNDLCPFEWFHFTCVSLITKPKGKWFCPKCRGDRSSVMKPKAQFLKELERYNKEKESKEEKPS